MRQDERWSSHHHIIIYQLRTPLRDENSHSSRLRNVLNIAAQVAQPNSRILATRLGLCDSLPLIVEVWQFRLATEVNSHIASANASVVHESASSVTSKAADPQNLQAWHVMCHVMYHNNCKIVVAAEIFFLRAAGAAVRRHQSIKPQQLHTQSVYGQLHTQSVHGQLHTYVGRNEEISE